MKYDTGQLKTDAQQRETKRLIHKSYNRSQLCVLLKKKEKSSQATGQELHASLITDIVNPLICSFMAH